MYLLIAVVLFALGYLGTTVWKNGWFNRLSGDVKAQEISMLSSYDDGTGTGDFLLPMNNARHTEEPVAVGKVGVTGYNYRLSQIFFKTEEDSEKETKIKTILDDLGINYENMYYTDKGYYTADLKDMGPYLTKKKYDEVVDQVKAAVSEAMVTHELYEVQFTLEGWYTIPLP